MQVADFGQYEWTVDPSGGIHEIVEPIDPMDASEAAANAVAVSYATGSGNHPIPALFCAFSTPGDRCTSDNKIIMSDPGTQVKMASQRGGIGLSTEMYECMAQVSHGGSDPISMDAYLQYCDNNSVNYYRTTLVSSH